ncbi:MAG: TIGR04255 family protein, partial [Acidimicrobiales bacterium]
MFGLDPAPRYRLSKPPLVQAFGQVKFPARAKLATMEGVAPVQELLDPTFPYMSPQQVQQVTLLVGPGGASAAGSPATQVWQFNDGGGWSLGLAPDTATLSVGSQYGEFVEFST